MPSIRSQPHPETVFNPNDEIDFHKQTDAMVYSYAEVARAREAVEEAGDMGSETISNPRASDVGRGVVGSALVGQSHPETLISAEPLTPQAEAHQIGKTLAGMRKDFELAA